MRNAFTLLVVLLLACAPSASAAPDKPAPPPPQANACRASGPVLFQIDHRVEPDAKLPTATVKVFASGAWTREGTSADGKPLATRSGCLAKPAVKELRTTLHGAAWKVSVAQVHCMAMSSTFIVFHVDGKQVFTERLCSGHALDDKSRAKLDAAVAQVEREVGKTAPQPE